MESRLRALAPVLRARSPLERHRLLADKRVVCAFCELTHNVLKKRIPLTVRERRRWCRYKTKLRSLVSRRNSYKHKTRLLQRGGFLQLLLPVAKTLLGALL